MLLCCCSGCDVVMLLCFYVMLLCSYAGLFKVWVVPGTSTMLMHLYPSQCMLKHTHILLHPDPHNESHRSYKGIFSPARPHPLRPGHTLNLQASWPCCSPTGWSQSGRPHGLIYVAHAGTCTSLLCLHLICICFCAQCWCVTKWGRFAARTIVALAAALNDCATGQKMQRWIIILPRAACSCLLKNRDIIAVVVVAVAGTKNSQLLGSGYIILIN